MINVRVLEEKIENGILEGRALENAKSKLEKISYMDLRPDAWDLENNQGTYGTEIIVTKDGHIDICICIMKKYSSRITYVKVGNFQPEFGCGDMFLPNGKEKEYKKLGNVINALNKEYEKYGFYFDDKNNRSILAQAKKEYEIANTPDVHMADAFQAELVNATQDEVPAILEKMFIRDDMMADEYDTLGECFNGCHDGLTQVTVANLRRMLEKCLEKNEITDTEIFVINYAYENLELSDDMFTMMEILRFKKEGIMPDYENFLVGEVHISVDEEKIAKFELCNLKVEMNHEEKEVLVYDVTKQLEGQVDLISYEKSIEKSQRLESPKRISKKEKITFDIDGEGALFLTEKKDVDYVTAQKEYRLRLQHAPESTYNKTDFDLKINGECVYGFRVDLSKGFDHKFNLSEELLRNLRFQKRVWSGEEYSWMQGEYREKRIKEQFGTEKEMIEFFDKIEKILVGLDAPEPTPETKTTTDKKVNKMEEKEMKAINKNGLNNRMVKLGEFLKENKDVDTIESKVFELFPNAMEMEIFEGDDVVYFLVGQDYAGKAPTKKEMKEIDYSFKEVDRVYGLSIYASVGTEKIKISASVGVDYTDRYGHRQYTDYTVKEIELELDLTMEVAKEMAETIRAKHNEEKISATYAWEKIKSLSERKTTEEVKNFLIGELPYYAYKEKKEKEKENTEKIEVGICKIDLEVQKGILWREKAEEKIERLYKYASTPELQELVDLAIKYIAVRKEDNIRVPQKLQEILNRRYKKVVNRAVEKVEKKITGQETPEQVQTILSRAFKNISIINNGQLGYDVQSKIVECYRGEVNDAPADAVQILRGGEVYIGIEKISAINETIIYVRTEVEYLNEEGEVDTFIDYLYYKEIKNNPDPEKDELDELIEEYNEVASEIDALQLNQSVGEDCSKAIKNKEESLMRLQCEIQKLGDVIVVTYSHKCFMHVPDGVQLFRTQEEVDKFKKETENILEIQSISKKEKKESFLDSQEESGDAPEPEKNNLDKMIKEHINEILDLSLKGDGSKRYKYEKTVAVKKQGEYQLTSMFMDVLTGMKVYIGHSGNMILTPNSEKKYVDDSIRGLLSDRKSINETIHEIKEKIKRKFEYSYSKTTTVIEPDETKVYVLISPEGTEVFWNYEDAYKHMLVLVADMEERFSYNYKPIIEEYGAKLDSIRWTIMEKTVL